VFTAPPEKNNNSAKRSQRGEKIECYDVSEPPRRRLREIRERVGSSSGPNRNESPEDQVRFTGGMAQHVVKGLGFFLLHIRDLANLDVMRSFCRVENRMQVPAKNVLGVIVIP
jgi:hypothetical protein